LRQAGFEEVFESRRNGSRLAAFRNRHYFDFSSPNMSLYVEGLKTGPKNPTAS